MIRRLLVTVVTSTVIFVVAGPAAFAGDIGLCSAGGGGAGSSASGVVLAGTGSGIDITTWAGIGIGLVLLGVYAMAFGPTGRRRGRPDTTSA